MHFQLLLFILVSLCIYPFRGNTTPGKQSVTTIARNDSFPANANYQIIFKEGKQGLKDLEGRELIPPIYEDIGWSDGTANVFEGRIGYKKNDRWGLINVNGTVITPAEYMSLSPYKNYAKASIGSKINNSSLYGIISLKGKVLVPFRYAGLTFNNDRIIAVLKSDGQLNYGLIGFDNEKFIPFEYFKLSPLSHTSYTAQNYHGGIAIFDNFGTKLTGFKIDSLLNIDKTYSYFYSGGKVGLLDIQKAKIILDSQYKDIKINDRIEYLEFPIWEVIDGTQKTGLKFKADKVLPLDRAMYKVVKNETEQVVNRNGTSISSLYSEIKLNDTLVWHVQHNGKHGVIDRSGLVIIPVQYDSLTIQGDFIYSYRAGGAKQGWQIFNKQGRPITKSIYEDCKPFAHGFSPVKRKGKWGFINTSGEEVVHCVYENLNVYSSDLIEVKFHDEEGIIDHNGKWVVYPKSSDIEILDENHYLARGPYQHSLYTIDGELIYFTENPIETRQGFILEEFDSGHYWQIDYSGVRVQESSIEYIRPLFKDSLFLVNDKGNVGLRQKRNGDIFFTDEYEAIYQPSEGFIKIKAYGKYGFVDFNGKLRIAHRYEDAQDFHEGFAAIKVVGKWGFINKRERIEIQPNYDAVGDFNNGMTWVEKNGKFGLINKKGELIEDIQFDAIEKLPTERFLIRLNEKFGLLDKQGEILVSPKYDLIEDLDNGEVIVTRNDKYGVLTLEGVPTIPPVYENIIYDPYNRQYLVATLSKWQLLQE